MKVMERIKVDQAYKVNCDIARMAGVVRPNFVEWGRVYDAGPDGKFRLVMEFKDTGKNTYEDDSGRIRNLPNDDTFYTMVAYLERVENEAT